jgi:hypothetical protein
MKFFSQQWKLHDIFCRSRGRVVCSAQGTGRFYQHFGSLSRGNFPVGEPTGEVGRKPLLSVSLHHNDTEICLQIGQFRGGVLHKVESFLCAWYGRSLWPLQGSSAVLCKSSSVSSLSRSLPASFLLYFVNLTLSRIHLVHSFHTCEFTT